MSKETTGNKPENKKKSRSAKFLKKLLRFSAWFSAIFFALLFLILIFRDSIIKSVIVKFGSWVTGSRVTLEHFETSLTTGELSIANLVIANPTGYDRKEIISLGSFYIRLQPSTLFSDHMLIEEIDVNKMHLLGEFKNDGTFNAVEVVEVIKTKLSTPDTSSDAPAETPPTTPQEKAAPQEITISSINIRDSFAIVYDDRIDVPVEIPLSYSGENITTVRDNSKPLLDELYDFAKDMEGSCNGVANAPELIKDTGKKIFDTTGKQLKDKVSDVLNIFSL